MRLLDWLPASRRRKREAADAARDAEITTRREHESEELEREALTLAHRLSLHRQQNHFADRMRAAYRGGGTQ